MKGNPKIALQTFTIRKELKNRNNLTKILKKVKDLGINSIELSRIPFNDDFIDFMNKACRENNISVGSTQMKLKEIEKNPAWTAKMHKKLDCSFCVVSVISFRHLKKGESGMKAYAEKLNRLGSTLKKKGVSLLYHHHNFEFVPIGNSNGFNMLLKYLDPESVGIVCDTYWLQRSGLNPATFIRDHKGLVRGVHLRDFTLKSPLWNPRIKDAELGQGNLDFRDITKACYESDVDYMAIEQATANPWKSLKISVDYLKEIGLENLF